MILLKDGEIKLKIVKRECIVLEEKAMHHHYYLVRFHTSHANIEFVTNAAK